MALCHSHVCRLLPSRFTLRHSICKSFTASSSPRCFRRPDTSFSSNASPYHTEQWAHRVMSRICQSGMLQPPPPLTSLFFYCWNKCHTAVVKASLCSFESICSVSWRLPWAFASHHFLPFPPSLFASCHQSTEPAVFTELTKIIWHILTAN